MASTSLRHRISIWLSHRASATFSLLSLVIYRCHPYGALPCIWKPISTKMSPLRGFAVHSKVEQTLEKPAFMQFREFLHDSRVAGWPLEKSAGAKDDFDLINP